jgi:hypothetical protein
MAVSDILKGLDPAAAEEDSDIWLELPAGFLPLPVGNSAERLAAAAPILGELCPPDRRELLDATLNAFAVLLSELEQRNTVYCGLGWHTAPDGETIVGSTLVVSVLGTGEKRNPRLLLGDLVTAAANSDDQGQADLVDLPKGPALFMEGVRSLGRPSLPGQEGDPGRADVYQLEVLVPDGKGDLLAVLEFSTPNVEYGTLYREMMVLLANSVSFAPPPGAAAENSSAKHIYDLLGGPGA